MPYRFSQSGDETNSINYLPTMFAYTLFTRFAYEKMSDVECRSSLVLRLVGVQKWVGTRW